MKASEARIEAKRVKQQKALAEKEAKLVEKRKAEEAEAANIEYWETKGWDSIQEDIKKSVEKEQWDRAVVQIRQKYENKPKLYLNLEKIRKSENLDRRLTWREVLERIFGFIDGFKSKDEKLEEECEKFISIHKPESKHVPYIKNYLKAYVGDEKFRNIINNKDYAELNVNPSFTMAEFKALNGWREIVPEYVKDYIPLNAYIK